MAARLLVIQHGADAPAARLGDWLEAAGLILDVRRPYGGSPLPADFTDHDGLLVLGGGMGAEHDGDAPWLPAVRQLLRDAVVAEVPTLGVCLGGQLLAVANGGRVQVNPDGPEFGAQLVAKRANAAADPLFAALPIMPDVIQWHFDAITALPAGSVQLASSPGCDVQAFRLGRLAWGVQFHIETTPEIVRDWAAADADLLTGYDVDEILRRSDAAHDDVAETWQPFAVAFAGVVADPASVRPGGAVPTVTGAPITDPAAIRAALATELAASRAPLPMPGLRSAELPLPGRRAD
jgi:GMP synthase (glutamine-hydrolysing)